MRRPGIAEVRGGVLPRFPPSSGVRLTPGDGGQGGATGFCGYYGFPPITPLSLGVASTKRDICDDSRRRHTPRLQRGMRRPSGLNADNGVNEPTNHLSLLPSPPSGYYPASPQLSFYEKGYSSRSTRGNRKDAG